MADFSHFWNIYVLRMCEVGRTVPKRYSQVLYLERLRILSMSKTKEVVYNTFGNIISLFCQWLIILLIPKISNFEEAGVFTVAVSVASILYFIASLALRDHQVSDQNSRFSPKDYTTLRIITVAVSFISIIPIQLLFDYTIYQLLVIIGYVAYRNVLNFAYLYAASLQIDSRLDYVGKYTALEGVISFVSFLAAYMVTNDLAISVFLMAFIGGGSYLLILRRGYVRYIDPEVRSRPLTKSHLRILVLIGIPLMFASLVPTVINALPKLLLQNMYGDAMAGMYGTLSAPIIVIPTLIAALFSPFITYFSNIVRSEDFPLFKKNYVKCNVYILLFGAVMVILSVFLQRPAFQLLYGHSVDQFVDYFAYLVAAIVFYSMGMVSAIALVTKNQWKYSAEACLAALIFSLIINVLMIRSSGFEGATFALVLSYLVYAVLNILVTYFVPLTSNDYDHMDVE